MSSLRVSIVQADLAWHDAAANRQHFSTQLNGLAGKTDLVVLPEMFTTGFSMDAPALAEVMDGPSVVWLREQASRLQAAICGSLIIKADEDYVNRFLFVEPDGSLQSYDKRHLFRLAGEHQHYAAGNERLIIDYRSFRLCPQVCYDLRFPVWSRNRGDYDLLLYVANWPSPRHFAWETLIRARAIENLSFVAAVNRSGQDGNGHAYSGGSAVVDYLGATLADLGDQEGVATVTLSLDDLKKFRERFAFHLDADSFELRDANP